MSAKASRFSPRSENRQALEERTVCRERLVETIVDAFVDAVQTGQARFELLIGPRGAGKSHLLGLIEGRLRERLEGAAIVAGLPEELHPSSLVHLLAEVLRAMPEDPEIGPVAQQLSILAASPEDAVERAVEMIRGRLHDKPLVIEVENLDVVLSAIGRNGQQRLRQILQAQARWSIIATSRAWAPAFSKEPEPFYGTFTFRELEPLSPHCCRDMLVQLARQQGREELASELDTPEGLARVQTLRHVLGGYPRAMAFIFPHLRHDRENDIERALEDLAEELTPYFQEQMSRLSPGQRPIAEALAEHWHPLSVSELSQITFTPQTSTSTHLRRLRRDAIVRSIKVGREHFYEISEPLFRIARAMKRQDLRAQTFLRVLHAWYQMLGERVLLPPEPPALDLSEYHEKVLNPAFEDLLNERWSDAISRSEAEHISDDPRAIALRLIALARSDRAEEAFSKLLASTYTNRVQTLINLVIAFACQQHELDPASAHELLDDVDVTPFEKMCVAVGTANTNFIETEFPRVPQAARVATTETMLKTFLLLRLRDLKACWRLLDILEPENPSISLEVNLSLLVLRAWGSRVLEEHIDHLLHDSRDLVARLSPAARFALDLAKGWSETTLKSLRELLHGRLGGPSIDRVWRTIVSVLVVEHISHEDRFDEFEAWARSNAHDFKALESMFAHAGYGWIAVGREMEPLLRILSYFSESTVDFSRTEDTADMIYARMAQPERELVRSLAATFAPHRHEVLLGFEQSTER